MGTLFHYQPKPESISSLLSNLSFPASPSTCENALPVHSPSPPAPCPTRLRTLFSHKSTALHSPFPAPSANSGKPGSHHLFLCLLIQNSSIPQPQFRKLTHPSTPSQQSSSPKYPLFLPERRVLLSISLISYPFSSSPSRSNRTSELWAATNFNSLQETQSTQESRETPPFSTRTTTPT
jgi:hypothetical protein